MDDLTNANEKNPAFGKNLDSSGIKNLAFGKNLDSSGIKTSGEEKGETTSGFGTRCVNKILLIGYLTRDPELRFTAQGIPVCTFGMATNRYWTTDSGERKDETEWHRIVAWRKLAEICAKILFKGRRAYIEGRLQTRSWTGQDGQERRTTEIVAYDMIVLDDKHKNLAFGKENLAFGKNLDSSGIKTRNAAGEGTVSDTTASKSDDVDVDEVQIEEKDTAAGADNVSKGDEGVEAETEEKKAEEKKGKKDLPF